MTSPTDDVRDQLLHAIDFNYAVSLGCSTPEDLLAAYDASRTPVDRAALRDRIAEAALHAVESALGDTLVPAAREEALAGIVAALPALPAQAAAPVCICGHPEARHFEDVCQTCGCGDYLEPRDAAEVIARWRQAALKVREGERSAVLREAAALAESLRQFEPATGARAAAQVSENVGIIRVADALRRMADETPAAETDEQRADREETERDHARGDHTHCGITCETEMPTEHLRNFVIAKGYPGTKGALAELERRAAAGTTSPVDLPARLEAVLTERYTELGNPFSRMRRKEKGPDGWPAEHAVGPHHVVEVLRELLAAGARQDGAGA